MTPRNHSRATLGARYGDQRRRREAHRAQARFYRSMFGAPAREDYSEEIVERRGRKETVN